MKLPLSLQHDSLEHAVSTFSQAFLPDSFQNYLVRNKLNIKGSEEITFEQNRELFSVYLSTLRDAGAMFVTAVDAPTASSAWLIEKPSESVSDDDRSSPLRAVAELEAASGPIWRRTFPDGQEVLHLILVGNSELSNRQKGHKGASYIIKKMLAAASKAGLPVCLEATNPMARDIYRHLGFEDIEEIQMGEGVANSAGHMKANGEGFPIMFMKFCGKS